MILQWITDTQKAAEMSRRIQEITMNGFRPLFEQLP